MSLSNRYKLVRDKFIPVVGKMGTCLHSLTVYEEVVVNGRKKTIRYAVPCKVTHRLGEKRTKAGKVRLLPVGMHKSGKRVWT